MTLKTFGKIYYWQTTPRAWTSNGVHILTQNNKIMVSEWSSQSLGLIQLQYCGTIFGNLSLGCHLIMVEGLGVPMILGARLSGASCPWKGHQGRHVLSEGPDKAQPEDPNDDWKHWTWRSLARTQVTGAPLWSQAWWGAWQRASSDRAYTHGAQPGSMGIRERKHGSPPSHGPTTCERGQKGRMQCVGWHNSLIWLEVNNIYQWTKLVLERLFSFIKDIMDFVFIVLILCLILTFVL